MRAVQPGSSMPPAISTSAQAVFVPPPSTPRIRSPGSTIPYPILILREFESLVATRTGGPARAACASSVPLPRFCAFVSCSMSMREKEAAERIAQLRDEIRKHDLLYYEEAAPIISDRQYDRLYKELVDLEAQFPDLVCRLLLEKKKSMNIITIIAVRTIIIIAID